MKISRVASLADIILGLWLLFSAFLWRTSPAHMVNAALIGVASVTLGAVALRGHGWARWLVGGLAVWLVVSLWVLPRGSASLVANHLFVGTLLFGFSVLPTGRGQAMGENPL